MATIVLFGFGALGGRLLRVLQNDYLRHTVVGVVDNDPQKTGRTVADLCPHHRFGDVEVSADLAGCLAGLTTRPDVLVHMTESKPQRIEGQLIEALEAGLNVLSAAESMFYPALRFPEFARRLDDAALAHGVSVSGCGINPGFSSDALPLLLARATSAVTGVHITRTIDVTGTGPGDIEHVGYGLRPDEFRAKVESGDIVGHMGGPETVALLAQYLDIEIDAVVERWDIQTADVDVDSGDPTLGILPPGRVVGITQYAEGHSGEQTPISTKLAMFYEPANFGLTEADTISIEGAMPIRMTIEPAVQSLFGAANTVASAIQDVADGRPGLINILDLPLAAAPRASHVLRLDDSVPAQSGRVPLVRATA